MLLASLAFGAPADLEAAAKALRSKDQHARLTAVIALEAVAPRSREVLELLADAAADRDPLVRAEAARALGASGPECFADLWKLLDREEPAVRRCVAKRLAALAPTMDELPVSARRLAFGIRDDDEEVSASLAQVAARLEPRSLDIFFQLFRDARPHVRVHAAMAAARVGGPGLVPRLLPLTHDENARVRDAAVAAMSFLDPPPPEAVDVLLDALKDERVEVRAASLAGLGRSRTHPGRMIPRLIEALGSTEAEERGAAAPALAAWGEAAIPYLVAALADANDLRADAAVKLVGARADTFEPLLEALRSEDERMRQRAARCLGLIAPRSEQPAFGAALGAGLHDGDAEVRAHCARALGEVKTAVVMAAIPDLVPALGDESGPVRAAALYALARGAPDDPHLPGAVARGIGDADREVRGVASYCLVLLGGVPPDAAGDLAAVALDARAYPPTRERAVRMLRVLGRAAEPALDGLAAVLKDWDQPASLRAAAAQTLGEILLRRDPFGDRSARLAKAPADVRKAVAKGLAWLAEAQSIVAGDGRWDCDSAGGWPQFDVGVTSLALLAFLGAGHDDAPGAAHPYVPNVRKGLAFLRAAQTANGIIRVPPAHERVLLEHALATCALCEAAADTGDRSDAAILQKAVDACAAARTPGRGWGYEPGGPKTDTFTTTWMMTALRFGELAGARVDRKVYADGLAWLGKMTDPNFGLTGYDYPGGQVFRAKGQEAFLPEWSVADTAAGLWCQILVNRQDPPGTRGTDWRHRSLYAKGMSLCCDLPPEWDDGHVDLCYWYFASLALRPEDSEAAARTWRPALQKALLPSQRADGSWDPDGAWGFAGGRIYATAMAVLCLLAPTRYPEKIFDPDAFPEPYTGAASALRDAGGDPDPATRAAAQAALERMTWRLPK